MHIMYLVPVRLQMNFKISKISASFRLLFISNIWLYSQFYTQVLNQQNDFSRCSCIILLGRTSTISFDKLNLSDIDNE